MHVPTPLDDALFDVAGEESMKQFYEERTISLNEETLELYIEQFDIHNIQRHFSQAWSEHEQEVMYGATTVLSMIVDPPEPYVIKQELDSTSCTNLCFTSPGDSPHCLLTLCEDV